MTLLITDGLPRGLGHFEIDQRASGIPVADASTTHFEADTYTCSHCNYVVVLNPQRVRERYKCKSCNHNICDGCAAKAYAGEACLTMKQRVDEHLERVLRQPDPSPISAVKE
jgi:hypothetical protein